MLPAKTAADARSAQGSSAIVPALASMLTEDPSSTKETVPGSEPENVAGVKRFHPTSSFRPWWRENEGRGSAPRDDLCCGLTSRVPYSSRSRWFLLRIQPGIRESATKNTAATPR